MYLGADDPVEGDKRKQKEEKGKKDKRKKKEKKKREREPSRKSEEKKKVKRSSSELGSSILCDYEEIDQVLFGGSDMDLRKKRRCPKEFLGGSPIEEDRFACEHRFVLHWQPFDSTRCFLHWKFATLGLARPRAQ